MKTNWFQKISLSILTMGLTFHVLRYFSPESWTTLWMDPENSILTTIFGNEKYAEILFGISVPSYFPIVIYVLLIVFVLSMYKVEGLTKKHGGIVSKDNGMTLIEVIVVIAIIGITAAIVYPYLDKQTHKHLASVREMHSVIRLAQSTAVTRNRPVSLCVNSDGYEIFIDGVSHKKINLTNGITITDKPAGSIGSGNISGTACSHITTFTSTMIVSSGNGEYNIHMGGAYYPIVINLAGGVSIGDKKT
jgi:prepilin-type N-terminal cleavage/methylation domain-containing protein